MIPTHQTKRSAGADVCAAEDVIIEMGQTVAVKTGAYVPADMPKGAWVGVYARSSLASEGLITSIGVIDADYKGEIKVVITNLSGERFVIVKGERIGQGKKNACAYIGEHEHMAIEIEQQIRAKLLSNGEEEVSEEDADNVTPITGA